MMVKPPINVLLVEDNPGDVRLIREMLADVQTSEFRLESVNRLSAAVEHLVSRDVDVVLLDLFLPDSQGLPTFTQLRSRAPNLPIVVLTGLSDESLAGRAV